MAAEKMKPCPFCGKEPTWFKGIRGGHIFCVDNKLRHHVTVDGESRADAVRNWNRRPDIVEAGVTIAQHRQPKICPRCGGTKKVPGPFGGPATFTCVNCDKSVKLRASA